MSAVQYAFSSTALRASSQTQSLQAALAALEALEAALTQLHAKWESTPGHDIEQEACRRTRLAYAVYEMRRLTIALGQD